MLEQSNLKKLIQKINSNIPQIQTRSLNNIYTKLTNQLIAVEELLQFPQLPGVLMSWINDNKKKSDTLLRVIHIISYYCRIDKGLSLLRQYQCLEFCEEFKIYLIQNQRAIDAFTQELQAIIRSLLPLGRANQSNDTNRQNIRTNSEENMKKQSQQGANQQKASNKMPKNISKQIKQSIKFKCQVLPLDQPQDKVIFQLLMKAKYANKDTIYITLTQIRTFVCHYIINSFRCKSDLITYLTQISLANIFPQLSLQIISIVLHGLIQSERNSMIPHSKQLINLSYAKVTPIQTMQIQISLPLKLFQLHGSFVIIQELILANQLINNKIPIRFMLSINYKLTCDYFLTIIRMYQSSQIIANGDICIPAAQQYCQKYPQKSHQFIEALPQQVWKKTKILTAFANQSQKQVSFSHIKQYLDLKQFQLTKNLHIMRQIIDNMKNGLQGVQLGCKLAVKFYVDVLATLAISVSKQDHIMSYYGQAQDMIITLSHHKNREVIITVYQQILQCLKNTKPIINYPGLIVAKHQVMQIIFTSPQFTKRILQNSLQNQNCLLIMMQVMIFFIQKDKFKIFTPYVAIIFALCAHPTQTISTTANIIIHKMPKNLAVMCIGCKLFSTNAQNRRKLMSDLANSRIQCEPDIVEKISSGHFLNKKKQLKLSGQSIQNYLNIIFNPGLDLSIRQTGIGQFIDCVDRIEGSQGYDFTQAQIILVEEIRKMNKKQKFDTFQQKLLVLHLLLCRKIDGICQSFTVQFMLGILCKITTQQCKAAVLTAIYLKLFQSPFNNNPCTKNWVMMYFPHIQMIKMTIQHPIRQQSPPQQQSQVVSIHSNAIKNRSKIDRVYVQLIDSIVSNIQISPQTTQILQQQIITAVTTTDISKISKLSLLCHQNSIKNNNKNKKITRILSKSTIKIILQYLRTNSVAIDIADDLIRFLRAGFDEAVEVIGNLGCLSFVIASYVGKVIAADQIDRLFKNVQDNISKTRVFKFLIQQKNIKYGSISEYNNLKLMQSIISSIRSNSNDQHSRIISLTMLNKLITSEYKISDHIATILSLLRNLLFENKTTTIQFSLALNCYSQLVFRNSCSIQPNQSEQQQVVVADKMTCSMLEQICSLIATSLTDNTNNYAMLASSYQFINSLLQNSSQYYQILQKQSHNMLIISTGILPKKLPEQQQQKCMLLMTQVYTFLYLYSTYKQQHISTLTNSTDIISLCLSYIVPVCANHEHITRTNMQIRVELLQAMGRMLYLQARYYDQFVFKLNKIIRADGTNAEYKLHYTIIAPVVMLHQYYSTLQKTVYSYQYIRMICWILYIWKQQSKILQDEQFIHPLVTCALQIKQPNILAPLLVKSNTAQKLVTGATIIGDKFKNMIKLVQELIYQKTKTNSNSNNNKKINQSKYTLTQQNTQQNINKIKQGIVLATTIYYPTDTVISSLQAPSTTKDTLYHCVRFIDQLYYLLQLEHIEDIRVLCNGLMVNVFRNQLCSKYISAIVSEGHFQIINKLITKLQTTTSTSQLNQQLNMLGMVCCNESVRSLVIKNRIIELLVNLTIAMDQNKVAKINYAFVYASVGFFYCLSAFKDTNLKIQNDKRLLQILAKILSMQQSDVVQQKILQLLINLAAYKHSKPTFMACKQIHKICLGLLSDPQYEHKYKVLTLIYNILYKNAAGIKMYKRKQVSQLISQLVQVDDLRDISEAVLQILSGNQ